jgi:hypothetical protein
MDMSMPERIPMAGVEAPWAEAETLDVMGNQGLLMDIREAVTELSAGSAVQLSKDEAMRLVAGSRETPTSQ